MTLLTDLEEFVAAHRTSGRMRLFMEARRLGCFRDEGQPKA